MSAMELVDALEVLTLEHRHIDRVLILLERAVARGREGAFVPASVFIRTANFLITYVDGSHHAKEMVLFQTMVAHRLPLASGLLAQVSGQHGMGSEQALALREAADAVLRGGADPAAMYSAAEDYLRLHRGHTEVEETRVFPMARRLLPPAVLERIRTRFARIEASHGPLSEAADVLERAFAPAPTVRPFLAGGLRPH